MAACELIGWGDAVEYAMAFNEEASTARKRLLRSSMRRQSDASGN